MTEAAQLWLERGDPANRLAIACGVGREQLERFTQTASPAAGIDVVEDVAEDQHAVRGAPERDMPRRVARYFKDGEPCDVVTLAQRAVDRVRRARPERLLEAVHEPWMLEPADATRSLHRRDIARPAPQRDAQFGADGVARTLMVGVGVGQRVGAQLPPCELAQDPPARVLGARIHEHIRDQVDVDRVGRETPQLEDPVGEFAHLPATLSVPCTAMPLAGLERHPHARAVLSAALAPTGSPSHAYLFHGPAGSGKAQVARAFAGELLAEGAGDPDGVRGRVLRDSHPDLTWVVPTGAAEMRVEDLEGPVITAATRTPFEAQRRVFVIEQADAMRDSAANRMLKTLEEPASFVHLILLTTRPAQVLPTIVSRCQLVRFDAPAEEQLAERLAVEGGAQETARACARLALGDGDRARALIGDDGTALRAAAQAVAAAVLQGTLAQRPWTALLERAQQRGAVAQERVEERVAQDAEVLPQKERKRAEREGADAAKRAGRRARTQALDEGLRLTGLWLRDIGVVLDGAPALVHNLDALDTLRAQADGRDVHSLRRAVALVDETRASLALNPSEELQLDALAIRLTRALA